MFTRALMTTTFNDFVASKIQAAWRRARDRRAYLERRHAVVVIQSRFRRNARREKVRVAVTGFRSGEATTQPKNSSFARTVTDASARVAEAEATRRTMTRRDTVRDCARRRLDAFRDRTRATTVSVRRTRSAR